MHKQKTLTLDGAPYFIIEKGEGVFQAVKRILNFKGEPRYETDSQIGELRIDVNMHETLYKGPFLCVEHGGNKSGLVMMLVENLRAFGEIAWYDYVAFQNEKEGCHTLKTLICSDTKYSFFKPRIFRKARNN